MAHPDLLAKGLYTEFGIVHVLLHDLNASFQEFLVIGFNAGRRLKA